jgi:hypothetical protein
MWQDTQSYYKQADNVFIGKVVSKVNLCEFDPTIKNNEYCFGARVYIVKPTKVYKHTSDKGKLMEQNASGEWVPKPEKEQEVHRDKQRYRTVYIPQGTSNCGVGFNDGEEFIIFSKGHGIFQQTSQCSNSGSVARKKDVIKTVEKLTHNKSKQQDK